MDKDRGYAWIILEASTILMCIGPSSFTSAGFLMYNSSDGSIITPIQQSWILRLFYCCWTLSAFVAACFAKQRPRQLSTTGAALACVGFLSSASSVQDSGWLYLTFSLAVGFGLGLSFHTAYLVVMSNFSRYTGLANGVCQTCIAVGQLTTPFLFTVVNSPKDRFHIKSLTAAIGFLTTLFFVVPKQMPPKRTSVVGDRNRRFSAVSRRSSLGEGVPLHSGFIVTGGPSNSIPINNQGLPRTRRRSQYLLTVSSNLLPNIPEEPESAHSANDTLTSSSSESELATLRKSLSGQSITESTTWNENDSQQELEATSDSTEDNQVNGEAGVEEAKVPPANLHIPLRRLSEGCMPAYVRIVPTTPSPTGGGSMTVGQNSSAPTTAQKEEVKPPTGTTATPPALQKMRRFSESQLQSAQPARVSISSLANTPPGMKTSSEFNKGRERPIPTKSGRRPAKGESIIDFRLLQDVHFVNMAAFSSLCLVTVVNFPVVLYFYIERQCADCAGKGNTALSIIYVVDLISRLLFSYMSDLPFISKRKMFLVGCFFAGVLIAAIPLIKDVVLIYCFAVLFGICFGMLATSEYLMFLEVFGSDKFSQAYGFVNLFKLVAVTVLGVFIVDPLAGYLYPVHPLDVANPPRSQNMSLVYDGLGLIDTNDSSFYTRLLVSVAVPAILCALAWLTEDIYKASQKCSVQSASKTVTSSNPSTDLP